MMVQSPPVPRCPGCEASLSEGQQHSVSYPILNSPPQGVRRPEEIFFCSACGLGIAKPLFTEEEEKIIYTGGEYWKNVTSKINLRRIALPLSLAANRFAFAEQFFSDGAQKGIRILDIGSGQGGFGLAAVAKWGSKIDSYTAVEPDPRMRSELKEIWAALKVKPPLTLLSELNEAEEGAFDLAVFSHVLEHVRQPVKTLIQTKKRLKPNGILLVEVPNQDFKFKADVFPHVLFYSKESLKTVFGKAGFETVDLTIYGRDQKENPLGTTAPLWLKMLVKIASRLRRFVPLPVSFALFNLSFGGNKKNDNGIWLRAAARPKAS